MRNEFHSSIKTFYMVHHTIAHVFFFVILEIKLGQENFTGVISWKRLVILITVIFYIISGSKQHVFKTRKIKYYSVNFIDNTRQKNMRDNLLHYSV